MDPVSLVVLAGVVVGGAAFVGVLAAATPRLRQKAARSRVKQLEENGLVVVDDDDGVAWARAGDGLGAPVARLRKNDGGGLEIRIRVRGARVVCATKRLGARLRADILELSGLVTSPFVSTIDGVNRELGHPDCILGGAPTAAINALADDDGVRRAVVALLRHRGGHLFAEGDELHVVFQHLADRSQEAEVRAALDKAVDAVSALDAVAARLPAVKTTSSTASAAVPSSSGAPVGVRR